MNILNFFMSSKFLDQAKYFFISFIIVVISFGGKLVSQSYASDDYFRMYFTEKWFHQADRGRWFASILNNFIFNDDFFVLPYFNTLISLFFITLSSFIITKIWNVKNQILICLLTLVMTVSPFWANNLFFNSNVTVSIGAFLSALGVFYLLKNKKTAIGSIFLILSFGIYQTVFQSTLIICLGVFILNLIETSELKELKNLIKTTLKTIFFIIILFIISQIISEVIFKMNKVEVLFSPYNTATRDFNLLKIIKKTIYLYTSPNGFLGNFILQNYYYGFLTFTIFLFGLYFSVSLFFNKEKHIKYKLLIVFFIVMIVLSVIIQLPRILGVLMPLRSCFHFSVLLSFFILLSSKNKSVLLKNITVLSTLFYLLLSFGYISSFYNKVSRQTASEINIANQIVNSIRLHPNYNFSNTDRPYFLLLGDRKVTKKKHTRYYNKPFYDVSFQALTKEYSKYELFKHFTDFKFQKLKKEERIKIVNQISEKNKDVGEYPERNSIFIMDDVVVVVLNYIVE